MWLIIQSTISTLMIFIASLIAKKKLSFITYVIFFVLFFIINLVFNSKVFADNTYEKIVEITLQNKILFIHEAQTEIEHLKAALDYLANPLLSLNPERKQFYQDKVKFHLERGEQCYNNAKNKCWCLPNLTEQEKAKYCFNLGLATLAPGGPVIKIAAVTLTFLTNYGLDCIDEWNYIESQLHEADYHCEMMEFYQEVLKTDGGTREPIGAKMPRND